MATNNIPNKNTALALNQKVSAGVNKYFSKVKSLTVGGTTYTPKSLVAVLQAEDDASTDVDLTRAQLQEQVANHRTAKANASVLRSDLKTYILGNYGKAAVEMLGNFGMSAPKNPGKKTAASKAQAVEKSLATRSARGTMGTKQRQSIHGSVPVQPEAAEAQPQGAPAATPAPVAQVQVPAQVIATHS